MNNQLTPIEKETLEKNFLKQNFKFVETNLDLSKKTWYANIWCYND